MNFRCTSEQPGVAGFLRNGFDVSRIFVLRCAAGTKTSEEVTLTQYRSILQVAQEASFSYPETCGGVVVDIWILVKIVR